MDFLPSILDHSLKTGNRGTIICHKCAEFSPFDYYTISARECLFCGNATIKGFKIVIDGDNDKWEKTKNELKNGKDKEPGNCKLLAEKIFLDENFTLIMEFSSKSPREEKVVYFTIESIKALTDLEIDKKNSIDFMVETRF